MTDTGAPASRGQLIRDYLKEKNALTEACALLVSEISAALDMNPETAGQTISVMYRAGILARTGERFHYAYYFVREPGTFPYRREPLDPKVRAARRAERAREQRRLCNSTPTNPPMSEPARKHEPANTPKSKPREKIRAAFERDMHERRAASAERTVRREPKPAIAPAVETIEQWMARTGKNVQKLEPGEVSPNSALRFDHSANTPTRATSQVGSRAKRSA
jgi:hypothetical protein